MHLIQKAGLMQLEGGIENAIYMIEANNTSMLQLFNNQLSTSIISHFSLMKTEKKHSLKSYFLI
jgi:hypothetical protein